jgi:hypothetical protein
MKPRHCGSNFESTGVQSLKKEIGCQALPQPIYGNILIEWQTMEYSEFNSS